MDSKKYRPWVIRWMYAVVIAHLMVGVLLPWIANCPFLDAYHHSVESGFWEHGAPIAARAQQVWWISLFGPTIQSMSLWMGVLVYIGNRQHATYIWIWLIVGIVVWAPQDMLISLRAGAWIHVWVDSVAIVATLPPLIYLWYLDSRKSGTQRQ